MKRATKFLAAMEAYEADDEALALKLMEECARGNDPVACFTTALWYQEGVGASRSRERCQHWLDQLQAIATEGNTEAQWELGQHFRYGNLLPLDIDRANNLLELAAQGGCGEAQHHLAWYMETGQYGYLIDPVSAAAWYQRAFEQRHPETLYLYAAKLFCNGQPSEAAIKLLTEAAANGFKPALEILRTSTQ